MTNRTQTTTASTERRQFVEHLEQASRIVQGWPKWKQTILGTATSMSNQSRSTESIRPPGPLLAEVGPYRIHETGYPDAPPGAVDVWRGEEFILQMGPVIRELVAAIQKLKGG